MSKHFKIITKEVGRDNPIETEYIGDVDRDYLIKFFGAARGGRGVVPHRRSPEGLIPGSPKYDKSRRSAALGGVDCSLIINIPFQVSERYT